MPLLAPAVEGPLTPFRISRLCRRRTEGHAERADPDGRRYAGDVALTARTGHFRLHGKGDEVGPSGPSKGLE